MRMNNLKRWLTPLLSIYVGILLLLIAHATTYETCEYCCCPSSATLKLFTLDFLNFISDTREAMKVGACNDTSGCSLNYWIIHIDIVVAGLTFLYLGAHKLISKKTETVDNH
jgi:hypothetical protein